MQAEHIVAKVQLQFCNLLVQEFAVPNFSSKLNPSPSVSTFPRRDTIPQIFTRIERCIFRTLIFPAALATPVNTAVFQTASRKFANRFRNWDELNFSAGETSEDRNGGLGTAHEHRDRRLIDPPYYSRSRRLIMMHRRAPPSNWPSVPAHSSLRMRRIAHYVARFLGIRRTNAVAKKSLAVTQASPVGQL